MLLTTGQQAAPDIFLRQIKRNLVDQQIFIIHIKAIVAIPPINQVDKTVMIDPGCLRNTGRAGGMYHIQQVIFSQWCHHSGGRAMIDIVSLMVSINDHQIIQYHCCGQLPM